MKDLLEYIVGNIVDDKSSVNVSTTEKDEKNIDVLISVAENDIGKVIGRQGKIISAIRTLVKSVGMLDGKKYEVEILGGEKKHSN
ncbi:MAG: KH domain-containing protein [Clostridia bacterium]|nr:KH domain-containing protein [Clostridia bacterium]